MAHGYGTVSTNHTFDLRQATISRRQECNLVSTWANLAVDVYRHSNYYENGNTRHLFVTLVSRVFETMRLRIKDGNAVFESAVNETIAPTAELFSCMADTLRWSLVRSAPNCGAYGQLPWIRDVVHCYEAAQDRYTRLPGWGEMNVYANPFQAIPLTGDKSIRPIFLLILRLLEACLQHRLLTGETTASDFGHLLAILGHPKLPPLPLDLSSEALAARRLDKPLSAVAQIPDSLEVSC